MARREALAGTTRAHADEPFALHGCIVTPDEAIEDGYVVVAGSQVDSVARTRPSDMTVIDTDGMVLPGLIDLHGHPEYNVFAAWEPPKRYTNRAAWRRSDEYAHVVRGPWRQLTGAVDDAPSLLPTLTRYAEARALIGGTTAIQGASAKYPDAHESLV